MMTDGEVEDRDRVLSLTRNHAAANGCSAIGLGSGADAGLVEGLAQPTSGLADFVTSDDNVSPKASGSSSGPRHH